MSRASSAARLGSTGASGGSHPDARPIVAELKERMGEELDYRLEADKQQHFRAGYEGHPWARVPEGFDEYSTALVLTTAWAEGSSFYDLLERSQGTWRPTTVAVAATPITATAAATRRPGFTASSWWMRELHRSASRPVRL